MTLLGSGRVVEALRRREEGFSAVEVLVAGVVMAIVASFFLAIITSINRTVAHEQERSENNSNARLALESIDREVRSAREVYDPALEAVPNYGLRIYTQANAPTRTPPDLCVQWQIQGDRLYRRTWPSGAPSSASGWRVVAEDVVNVDEGVPAFVLQQDPATGARYIEVTILVNGKLSVRPAQTVRLQTSLTGRNVPVGTTPTACEPAPGGAP